MEKIGESGNWFLSDWSIDKFGISFTAEHVHHSETNLFFVDPVFCRKAAKAIKTVE
jgi:hypothetical protein